MLKLRKVDENDFKTIYEWRNDEGIRPLMFNENEITIAEHTKFWKNRIKKKDDFSLMIIYGNKTVGFVRLDKQSGSDGNYEVGIIIDPNLQGKGIGTKALTEIIKLAKKKKIKILSARIKKDNLMSKKLFEKVSFIEKYSYYEREL